MDFAAAPTAHLFAYGTLQTEAVQRALFGRRLDGQPDALGGYRLALVEVADGDFAAASGTAQHRSLQYTGNPADVVAGTVFRLTAAELAQADAYEPADYARVPVLLQSGLRAWVYRQAAPERHA